MAREHLLSVRLESASFDEARLRVKTLVGRESISQLFDFALDVVCLDREGADVGAMMGADVTLVIEREGFETRRIRGMVAEVDDLLDAHADVRAYRVRVVPRAFRLTMIRTQDVFMDLSVPEIIAHKLGLVGVKTDLKLRLIGSYPKRELVIQYAETDLAFVCRLAEHVGISFFFEHQGGREEMVFTDHPAGFQPVKGAENVVYRGRGQERDVFELRAMQRLIPAFYAVQDYNYRTPQLDLSSQHAIADAYAGGVIEHGGHFKTPDEGKALAQVRAEEQRASQLVYAGKSDVATIAAGARCTIEEHPDRPSLGLLVVEVEHRANLVVAGVVEERAPTYVNAFRAIPGDRMYRPPLVTPRPRIGGLITGIIDPGPGGTDKHAQIDEEGRYTVRFLFDTTAAPGERKASRPVRMLQNHTGENYGTHFPLRPGAEVLIGFVNGDPDRPVIVGAAPNPTKPSPVTNRDPGLHRIRTGTGIVIDLVDDT